MPPFELPDFYMPWPARVNPNIQGARTHCKEWAYMVGILGAEENAVWDEATFDRMDFPAFTAATHPDAPAIELDLLSDWYVWGWFIDDYFAQAFERGSSDIEQAKGYLSRLFSFMSKDLDTPIPEPQNPAECALADLWSRTAPTMSVHWRQRFVEHIRVMAEASRQELLKTSKNKERILDPVEYITLRRKLSGMSWAADLVEHSLASEIPPEIYDTRPIRVLNDTYADRGALWNDILSYHHDIDDGKVNNCVVVLQHFLNTDLQTAVNLVNDLATSRLYQFENTLTVELYPAMDERRLDGAARQQVLRYVKALQDWMAGELEWALRPGGRYLPAESRKKSALGRPKGLGTAAARIGLSSAAMGLRIRTYNHVPFQTVGEITLPEFYMPFSTELNPHLDEGRRTSKQWAYEMGMIGIPGISIWDEQKFDGIDVALMCALVHPKAPTAVYDLTTKCYVWGFYADGYFDERYLATRDIVGGRAFLARQLALISSDSVPIVMPTDPSERGLADLWQRMAASLSPERKQQMRCAMAKMFKSWVWELDNQIQNRIPDPIDYVETRLKTFGFDIVMLLNHTDKTPPELYDTPAMCSLHKAAGHVVVLTNDIVSYQKEMESTGILSNGVLVTQHFLDCDLAQAVEVVNNLITARVREFEHIVATEIPDLCDDFNLDTSDREKLFTYIEQLQFMMSGLLKWHLGASYYKESEFRREPSPRNLFNVPTALGTSATRITSLFSDKNPSSIVQLIQSEFSVDATNTTTDKVFGVLNGLGTSAAQIATPSIPETNESSIQSIPIENAESIIASKQLFGALNGLGTSATKIGKPSIPETDGESIQSMPIENAESIISPKQLFGILNGLGTSATKIGSLVGSDNPVANNR